MAASRFRRLHQQDMRPDRVTPHRDTAHSLGRDIRPDQVTPHRDTAHSLGRDIRPDHKAEKIHVKLKSLNSVLAKYQIPLDHGLINRVFEKNFRSFPTASARRLRDKIAHLFHNEAIDKIRSRGDRLLADMGNVMKAIGEKADSYRGF